MPPSGSPVELIFALLVRASIVTAASAQAALPAVVNGLDRGALVVTVPRRIEDETHQCSAASLGGRVPGGGARLVVALRRFKDGQIYDIIGTQNLYGEESLFINFG
jgi:hypothetical protein